MSEIRQFHRRGVGSRRQRGASRVALLVGAAVLALVVAAAALYGPDLLGYYRFDEALKTIASEEASNGGPWPRLTDECVLCHGFNGNPVTQAYARLAGQPAKYLEQRLRALASDTRASPIMGSLAATMSPDTIKELADFYARQPVASNAYFVGDPAQVSSGERIVRNLNCAACHGETFAGHDEFPRLAGQGYDYLVEQLTAFKTEQRRDATGVMTTMAGQFSADDIRDVSQYLAGR